MTKSELNQLKELVQKGQALIDAECPLRIEGKSYELASYGPPYSDGSREATLRLKDGEK